LCFKKTVEILGECGILRFQDKSQVSFLSLAKQKDKGVCVKICTQERAGHNRIGDLGRSCTPLINCLGAVLLLGFKQLVNALTD
jgi:hypothetical protein